MMRRQESFNEFLMTAVVFSLNESSARRAGSLAATLDLVGKTLAPPDVLIAGIALEHNLTLVTNNTSHFSRVSELRIVSWRD